MENEKNLAQTPGKAARRILSVSLATASLLIGATSAFGSLAPVPVMQPQSGSGSSLSNSARTLPSPLLLTHASSDQQLVAQHGSHVSHGSHSSHGSHTSHTSGL